MSALQKITPLPNQPQPPEQLMLGTELLLPADWFNLIHHGDRFGTVFGWHKNQPQGLRHYRISHSDDLTVLKTLEYAIDFYMNANEFRGWRTSENLSALRCWFLDFDKTTDHQSLLDTIEALNLPRPTAWVRSGRGTHLYWVIDRSLPASARPVWQQVQDRLIAAMLPHGVDPCVKDATRVMRLVGTVNRKTETKVYGAICGQRYGFHAMCDAVLGKRAPYVKKLPLPPQEAANTTAAPIRSLELARAAKRKREGCVTSSRRSPYQWWYQVHLDLMRMAEYCVLGGIPEDYRDKWLFVYATSLSWFKHTKDVEAELIQWSKAWVKGLTLEERKNAIKHPLKRAQMQQAGKTIRYNGKDVDARYYFRRETLYSWFEGLFKLHPELEPQMRCIISKETRKARRLERQEELRRASGMMTRAQYLDSLAGSIERQKPWEAEGISRRWWYKKKSRC